MAEFVSRRSALYLRALRFYSKGINATAGQGQQPFRMEQRWVIRGDWSAGTATVWRCCQTLEESPLVVFLEL